MNLSLIIIIEENGYILRIYFRNVQLYYKFIFDNKINLTQNKNKRNVKVL